MADAAASLRRLRQRREFLQAARGVRASRVAFALQAVPSAGEVPGVGFTVTKKVGNAPERNRIKRRLREAARACVHRFAPRHDYVLIGRREALSTPFSTLVGDLEQLLDKVARAERKRAADTDPRGTGTTP